jgi:hypothetical protein
MKTIKIKIKNLYAGYRLGGLTPDEAMYLSDTDRFGKMVSFIIDRSRQLAEGTTVESFTESLKFSDKKYTARFSGVKAYSSIRNIQIKAEKVQATMSPMDIFVLGQSMESLISDLLVADGFIELGQRSENGKINGKLAGEKTAEEAKERGNEVELHWNNLRNKPERDRSSIIASRMGITPKAVRSHISSLGLRSNPEYK